MNISKYITLSFIAIICCIVSCSSNTQDSKIETDSIHYWHPQITTIPKAIIKIDNAANNLFAQSISGVVNKALKNNESEYGIWLEVGKHAVAYNRSLDMLSEMGVDVNYKTATLDNILLCKEISSLIKGYILTDVKNNPESEVYASTAAHVYDAVIVDVKDVERFTKLSNGNSLKMLCDATQKTTEDAWLDFKDKCNNKGLIVMPVTTSQLRDFAISQELFLINLNKVRNTPKLGQNAELLKEVLASLEPNSPVYGWEGGVGEDVFVGKVSEFGHMMVPYDWAYNTALTSLNYKSQQEVIEPYTTTPQSIDFNDTAKKYVSFYLSDGDNVQWMLNGFENPTFYCNPLSTEMKMGYGVAASNLSMIAPAHFKKLMVNRANDCSLIETFGGGYYYVDTFGKLADRESALDMISKKVAKHMQSQGLKVLALMAQDIDSDSAKEAYQKYISNNSKLDGIVAMQYSPYAGGNGEIFWFTNNDGIDIPVITVKYSLWNFRDKNHELEGSPTYIANKINEENGDSPFSLLSIHAWSSFADMGDSTSETLESTTKGKCIGAGAAKLCVNKLDKETKIINTDELIWRVRMYYREEQTREILSKIN